MPTHDPSALDTLWTPQALIAAVLCGEALAAVVALAAPADDRWIVLGLVSLLVQWIALTSLGAIYLLRKRLTTFSRSSLAWICLCLLVAVACLVGIVAQSVFFAGTGTEAQPDFLPRLLVATLIVGLLGSAAFQNYDASRRAALRAKQAELEALQARIHPHFLFNTLNSAVTLIHARPAEAEQVLLDMSDLFRAALAKPGWVSLEKELDLCRRYLEIERQRFGDRLRVRWEVAQDIDGLSVPLLTLQPLVENAVAHGLDRQGDGKSLLVRVKVTPADLTLLVENPLPPPDSDIQANGHGVGLAGVRARIESATQNRGQLIAGAEETTFVARLVIPRSSMPLPAQTTTS